MRQLHAIVLAYALLVALPGSVAGTTAGAIAGRPAALYFVDTFLGTDPALPVIYAKGYTVTHPVNWAQFTQALKDDVYDLAVLFYHSGGFVGTRDGAAVVSALSAHLAAGRTAWVVDWDRDPSLAAVFQGGYAGAGAINQQPMTVSYADLAAGVANPLPLADPRNGVGWVRWSWGLVASDGGAALASLPDGSPAVVLGNERRSALLGFIADTITGQDGQRFFENLLDITVPAPPAIQPLAVQPPSCVAAVGAPVTVTVPATDPNGNLVAQWLEWGDGEAPDSASFAQTNAFNVTFSHKFAAAGFYRIAASVTDADGTITSRGAACLVAVYDAADSATGSGWVASPAGAFKQNVSLAGKATFAARAKYPKGASTPKGMVKFSLPSAKLSFKSSSLEWLVLSGASTATLKGAGTLNRKGGYEFLASMVDGFAAAGGGDKIRVKIIKQDSGATVFDNQLEGDLADEAAPTAAIGGGNVRVIKFSPIASQQQAG